MTLEQGWRVRNLLSSRTQAPGGVRTGLEGEKPSKFSDPGAWPPGDVRTGLEG